MEACLLQSAGLLAAQPELRGDLADAARTVEDWRPLHSGATEDDKAAFDMWCLKVTPCPKRCVHDWSCCPFAHEGERARRRDPRLHNYTAIACVSMKQEGRCALGDACPHAHSAWEYWLHPSRYHTALCKQGQGCNRRICFFAHHPSELRTPAVRPGAMTCTALAGAALGLGPTSQQQQLQHLAAAANKPSSGTGASSPTSSTCSGWLSQGCNSSGGLPEGGAAGLGEGLEQQLRGLQGLGQDNNALLLAAVSAGMPSAPVSSGPPAMGLLGPQADAWLPPSPPPQRPLVAQPSLFNNAFSTQLLSSSQHSLVPAAAPQNGTTGEIPQTLLQAVAGELALGRISASQAAAIIQGLVVPQQHHRPQSQMQYALA